MSNRLPFIALAVACVAAAGAGSYLATRQNAVPTPAAAQTASSAVPAEAPVAAPAAQPAPVQEAAPVAAAPTAKAEAPVESPKPKTMPRAAKPATTIAKNQQQAPLPPAVAPAPLPQAPPPPDPAFERAQEPPRPVEPPRPSFEELVIPRDSVIGLQTENRISSETAQVEDRVDARVTRDVRVSNRVAIPAGSRVVGTVTQVERGGKFKEQARLGIRFNSILLPDGTKLPISTETIVRLGEAPGNGTAAKIGGGTVGGAIIGAILGGAKGAAIGATAGAGAGTAAVTAGQRSTVVLPAGTPLSPRILSPVTVTLDR